MAHAASRDRANTASAATIAAATASIADCFSSSSDYALTAFSVAFLAKVICLSRASLAYFAAWKACVASDARDVCIACVANTTADDLTSSPQPR